MAHSRPKVGCYPHESFEFATLFHSPMRAVKKEGNLKNDLLMDQMVSFLFCLCSNKVKIRSLKISTNAELSAILLFTISRFYSITNEKRWKKLPQESRYLLIRKSVFDCLFAFGHNTHETDGNEMKMSENIDYIMQISDSVALDDKKLWAKCQLVTNFFGSQVFIDQ